MAFQKTENLEIDTARKLPTPKEINELNRQFWSKQTDLMDQMMADPEILKIAMKDIESESLRQVPVYNRKSFARALETAAKTKADILKTAAESFQSGFSKRGGTAPKADALQRLIVEIVQRKPNITEPELLGELENKKLQGIITDIDHDLNLVEFRNNNDGQLKKAPISGLKDRLSRAKKKLCKKDSR
jgi:hypothetical protein